MKFLIFFLFILTSVSGCPRIGAGPAEKLPLPAGEAFFYPRFDASGEKLLLTSGNYRGLKMADLNTGNMVTISAVDGAGYAPHFSGDGSRVIFVEQEFRENLRYSRLVSYSLANGETTPLRPFSRELPQPVLAGSEVLCVEEGQLKSAVPGAEESVLPNAAAVVIEEQQLVLYRQGERKVLEPYPLESYIWPSLSPDGKKILAYAMGRGSFVCDLDGEILFTAGSMEAPVWAGDRLVAGMVTSDDGHRITRSEVVVLSTETGEIRTISPPGSIALFPAVSVAAGRIAWHTPEGEVFVQKYILNR